MSCWNRTEPFTDATCSQESAVCTFCRGEYQSDAASSSQYIVLELRVVNKMSPNGVKRAPLTACKSCAGFFLME